MPASTNDTRRDMIRRRALEVVRKRAVANAAPALTLNNTTTTDSLAMQLHSGEVRLQVQNLTHVVENMQMNPHVDLHPVVNVEQARVVNLVRVPQQPAPIVNVETAAPVIVVNCDALEAMFAKFFERLEQVLDGLSHRPARKVKFQLDSEGNPIGADVS